MRVRGRVIAIAIAGALAGCGGAGESGSGSGSGSESGPRLRLPPGEGPPRQTTSPLPAASLDRLAALDMPDFDREVRERSATTLELRYRTRARPQLWVTISVAPCFDCLPADLGRWRAAAAGLRTLLPPELRELPTTTFEITATTVAGAPAIATAQLAWAVLADPRNAQRAPAYSHAVAVYYNDGASSLRVVAALVDDPPASREALVELAPRADLERIATAFAAAVVRAW